MIENCLSSCYADKKRFYLQRSAYSENFSRINNLLHLLMVYFFTVFCVLCLCHQKLFTCAFRHANMAWTIHHCHVSFTV